MRAAHNLRFFRTGVGEYGEGDRFLGLTMPQIRSTARDFTDMPLADIDVLLESDWHEIRLLAALLLVTRYGRGDARLKQDIYRLYLRRTDRINNWDLVDLSAPRIVGAHLFDRSRAPLRRLANSKSLWERRIAILATHYFIARGDFDDTIAITQMLFDDREDLIHKAIGWMLREVGKRDEAALLAFLDTHASAMPRTSLRYALERLSPARRKRYMAVPRQTFPR